MNIGLYLNLDDNYDRAVASGILSFAKGKDWNLYGKGLWFSKICGQHLDGLIARIESEKDADECLRYGVPVVDIAGATGKVKFNIVKNDDELTGTMAGHYLKGSGAERFAIVLVKDVVWSQERFQGYLNTLSASPVSIPSFSAPLSYWHDIYGMSGRLEEFLLFLDKPTALFCVNDLSAMKVVLTCNRVGIRIPEDLLVMGVDNEELMCMLAKPSISSLGLRLRRIGYEAASRLQEVVGGGDTSIVTRYIPPTGIMERESSMCVYSKDPLVAKTVMNIKRMASSGLSCGEMIAGIPLCRRRLEERFTRDRGRTILEEVILVRLAKAENLLASTDIKIEEIWKDCGFGSAQRFFTLFKKKNGMTPDMWRKANRY